MRHVFQTRIENAIAYSGDAPPRIDITADPAGERWRVSVADRAIGIDPGERVRILGVFERLHTREEPPGTGIGLALCERIVDRHGGDICRCDAR